jgi:Fe-S cluster biosynthesis and repair protein YggX
MTRIVHCIKLKKDTEGLKQAPYPGELGNKIFDNISAQAWEMWLGQQTMLINEYRLSLIEPKAREFLEQEMINFLFEDKSVLPAQYKEVD